MPGRSVPEGVAAVVADMQTRLDALAPDSGLREFLGTYQRTTTAVGKAILDDVFEDPDWVEEWDVVFARLYLDAYDAYVGPTGVVPRPWRIAFEAPADLPALRQVLLGINAHVNYDLPQALLAVIPDEDFANTGLLARRQRDHEAIDGVLASRVAAEDQELAAVSARSLVDRVLQPLNRRASRRFLTEARQKVWHNARELQAARLVGPTKYDARLAELEVLSAAKVADLLAPGQVLLRLAVAGFGVLLPPPA
jgi:uncharacterized protein DUF5995